MSALNIAQPIVPPAMQSCFEHQRAAYLATPERSYAQRVEDLKKLARMLKTTAWH